MSFRSSDFNKDESSGESMSLMEDSFYDEEESVDVEKNCSHNIVKQTKSVKRTVFVIIIAGVLFVTLIFIVAVIMIHYLSSKSKSLKSFNDKQIDENVFEYQVVGKSDGEITLTGVATLTRPLSEKDESLSIISDEGDSSLVFYAGDNLDILNVQSSGYHCHGICQPASMDYFLENNPGLWEKVKKATDKLINDRSKDDPNYGKVDGIRVPDQIVITKMLHFMMDQRDGECFKLRSGMNPRANSLEEATEIGRNFFKEYCGEGAKVRAMDLDSQPEFIGYICEPYRVMCRQGGCWSGQCDEQETPSGGNSRGNNNERDEGGFDDDYVLGD